MSGDKEKKERVLERLDKLKTEQRLLTKMGWKELVDIIKDIINEEY